MKTLYVSDLDGTLLDSTRKLSTYTLETINGLIQNGMYFSYATARSLVSASLVTKGLTVNLPVITFNGTFISNASTGEKLYSINFTKNQINIIIGTLEKYSMFPLVYSFINNEEKVSWIRENENEGIKNYLDSRKGDKRLRPVSSKDELYSGEIFTVIFIGTKEELTDAYSFFVSTNEFTCYLQQELYRNEFWCEIMPKNASKGNAVLALKEILNCGRLVTFGDEINDISMFEISDESYAVDNASDDLKKIASGVIKSNDNNGVADWLKKNWQMPQIFRSR